MRSFNYNLIILIIYNLFENKKLEKRIYDYIYMFLKKEIKRYIIINNNNSILKKTQSFKEINNWNFFAKIMITFKKTRRNEKLTKFKNYLDNIFFAKSNDENYIKKNYESNYNKK